ncbi:tetratricopeptide (TPR) repeat protein [Deinococcus sp. HSC-46F16]|uniref:hypothetical protein n=1 Tax=Deinococcus sp. HSC-46F16 TaxID=2910968 RepID=UPI00209D74CB|nr:hypothetical protein [Deinococcus sp. HSC-46F16]MCP2015567.1 tetratricopeptide (TPR) repeat protein [Deinococcus sp. HSC-46F16]
MSLVLLPDLGDLLRMHPQLNAGTLAEALRCLGLREVLWASGPDPDHPLRDALPAAGFGLEDLPLSDPAPAAAEHEQLVGFLNQYPQGRERLRAAGRAEAEFTAVLTAPLTLPGVLAPEMEEAVTRYHAAVRDALGEGPGTRWRERRLGEVAQGLAGRSGAVLAPLDDLFALRDRVPGAALPDLTGFAPGETSRRRALADRAWQLREEDDLEALLSALDREEGDAVTPEAELLAAGAGLCLAVGDLDAARTRLERAAHALRGDEPRSLPGLVLARLGQVRDAQGDRELAERTYRAVLALSYAPAVARETAGAGLQDPFRIEV